MESSLQHQLHKFMIDRATHTTRTNTSDPPPAYTASKPQQDLSLDIDTECDDIDLDAQDDLSPHVLNINAGTTIIGHGNLLHVDALHAAGTRVAAALVAILKDANGPKRPVQLNVDLGVRVTGMRNVIAGARNHELGPVKTQGSKRKAEGDDEQDESTKRPKMTSAHESRANVELGM